MEGIRDIRDESNREGIRVSIDLRSGVEPETVKRQLYKNTQIESSFGFNTLAIVEGKPKTCNLKDFLSNFLLFREDVVIKKTKMNYSKYQIRIRDFKDVELKRELELTIQETKKTTDVESLMLLKQRIKDLDYEIGFRKDVNYVN